MHVKRFYFLLFITILAILAQAYGHIYGEAGFLTAGGKKHIPVDDPTVQELSRWAAKKLGGKCIEVYQAEDQVVSGMLYYINFVLKKAGKDYCCKIKVWCQPWRNWMRLVGHNCVRLKRYRNEETMDYWCPLQSIL